MKTSRSTSHPFSIKHRVLKHTSHLAVCAAGVLLGSRAAHAFGAEDLLNGPFHHEVITETAAEKAGFKGQRHDQTSGDPARTEALDTLGWSADYIDSYLYSPLWWAADAGLDRFKVSISTSPELERLHFDDLFSSDQVHHMWRRYATGTMAGLLWAANRYKSGDASAVHAAQNIVSVSLHAMQDFYSHSNWVDDPARRSITYFDVPRWERARLNLYTGAYEHDEHLGIKHHGKFGFDCTLMNQPGLKQAMDAACGMASPMAGSPVCESFKACQRGVTVQHQVGGVTVPNGLLYLAPPGIALDNTWMAPLSVQQRGLTGVTAMQMFNTARSLAIRQ